VTEVATFAPPPLVSGSPLLWLGERVRWTHRAAVVRWHDEHRRWHVSEPKGSEEPTILEERDLDIIIPHSDDPWYRRRDPRELPFGHRINKSVVIWPEEGGDACVIGLIRRAVGESRRGSGRTVVGWGFEEEYEQGSFQATGYVNLYVLKSQLVGLDYFYAPWWAVTACG
jgi:hypothetical protein